MNAPRFTLPPLTLLLLMLLLPVATACGNSDAGETEQAAEDQPVMFTIGDPITDSTLAAIVTSEYGSDTLTTDEFRSQIERVRAQFPQMSGDPEQERELRRSMVEQFAMLHALDGEVSEGNLEADPAQLEEQMEGIRSRFETEEEFQEALAQQDITEPELRESLQEQLNQQNWRDRQFEAAATPTDQEVEAFREEQSEQVRAQHILFLSPTPDPEIETRARAVLDTVKAGTVSFEELARRHSDDGTAANGGDLDYFSRGEMVEPFSEAAFALRDSGDVADNVVRTQFGYHLIRLTGRRTGEMMPAEQAREVMQNRNRQEAVMDALDRLRGKVTVRINEEVVDADLNDQME